MGSRKGRNSEQKRKIKAKLVRGRNHIKCPGCNKFFAPAELTIDHIIPLNKGGSWNYENLRLMCLPCNQNKGDSWDLEKIFNELQSEKDARKSDEVGREVDETSN